MGPSAGVSNGVAGPTQKLIAFAPDCEMRPPGPIDQIRA